MKLPIIKSLLIVASLLQAPVAFSQIKRPIPGGGDNRENREERGERRGGDNRENRGEDRGGDRHNGPGGGRPPVPGTPDPRPRPPDPGRPGPGRPDPRPPGPGRPDPRPPGPVRPDPRPPGPGRPDPRPPGPVRPDPRPPGPRPDPGYPGPGRPDPRPPAPRPPHRPEPRPPGYPPTRPDYPRPIPPPHSSYGESTVRFQSITRRTGGEWVRVAFYSPSYIDRASVQILSAGLKIHEAYAVTVSGRRVLLRELSYGGVYYAYNSVSSEYISAGERIGAVDIRVESMGAYADIDITVQSSNGAPRIYPTRP